MNEWKNAQKAGEDNTPHHIFNTYLTNTQTAAMIEPDNPERQEKLMGEFASDLVKETPEVASVFDELGIEYELPEEGKKKTNI